MRLLHYETWKSRALQEAAKQGQLYAVLDACGSNEILEAILRWGPITSRALFQGELLDNGWSVSPYILSADEPILDWIENSLWQEPWGILLVAPCGWDQLHAHLRELLFVRDERGVPLYFRFYDPRVLAMFLPTCTAEQLGEVFGPIQSFGVHASQVGTYSFVSRHPSLRSSNPAGH